ncbi:hypothetical protein AAFF_G00400990 [Aldrovandia affinis]|uniref:CCDC144C-like coiled-coil domain-containing protein n=1 Tax=Aldrovandia affinis TaxID=143900 RepID=A0AAD7SCL1_9TELE|nr:hypothetical protein AAFF_G00400990 [Aldrovandia affinis]
MEKNAWPQGSDELEQEKRARKWLELELAIAQSEVADSRAAQAEMEFALQRERGKYQQLEEKHVKKEVMKGKLIKKVAQIEESVLKLVRSNKQITMKSELQGLMECEEIRQEVMQCQLLEELADTKKKLAISEELLAVKTRRYCDLEEEQLCMQKDMNKLETMMQNSLDQSNQSEHYVHTMKCALDHKEQEVFATSQKLQEVLSASAAMDETITQLGMSLQQMKIENTRLNDAAKKQAHSSTVLQTEADEAALANEDLTERLNREVQKQNMLYIYSHGQLMEKETALLNEKQKMGKAMALQGALQEQLEKVRNEGVLLCQQVEEAKKRADVKEQEVTSLQEHLKKMCTEYEMLETSKERVSELQEILVCERRNGQSTLRKLQQELGDTQTKLSVCEGSLEVNALHCRDLEKEKRSMEKNMSMLKELLQESEDKHKTLKQLEQSLETVQQLKTENTNLQATAEQQISTIATLQNEVEEATRLKRDLEEQPKPEAKEQSSVSLNAQEQTKERMAALLVEQENAIAQQEALQKQLEHMQADNTVLHQQLKDSHKEIKEQAGVQKDRFAKMQAHYEKKVQALGKRSKELVPKYSGLHTRLDSDKTGGEYNWRQVQQELGDTQPKSLINNVPLEVIAHHCSSLEDKERSNMEEDLKRLEKMIKESENLGFS